MARRAYARRYAQAVFEIALEKKELDRWQADLTRIVGVVSEAAFLEAMESPRFGFEPKAQLLAEKLKEINPLALNLVKLLVARGKLDIISDIAAEYQRSVNGYHGIEQAEVTTAVPLDDEAKEKLAEKLGAVMDKKVIIESEVDPNVVGGFIARIGGKLLDGSTRSNLLALKKDLIGVGSKR